MSFPLGWHFKVADCGVGIVWELWSHVLGICLCFVVPVLIWWLLLAFFFLDLWKHQVMKENFSVVRPQIVEKFVQRLMESSQDNGPKVCTQN